MDIEPPTRNRAARQGGCRRGARQKSLSNLSRTEIGIFSGIQCDGARHMRRGHGGATQGAITVPWQSGINTDPWSSKIDSCASIGKMLLSIAANCRNSNNRIIARFIGCI